MLLVFDKIFDKMNDVDKRKLIESMIAEVHLHPKETWEEGKNPIKEIKYAFLVSKEVMDALRENVSSVETCCLHVRECANDDEMVSIKVDLEGISLDQGKFEPDEKPIYGNIKKWIKEKYGFNVTNLYIGQIKDKVGMEKHKNYNIGSGESRVPTCRKEMEEAIIEAFKHFGLI